MPRPEQNRFAFKDASDFDTRGGSSVAPDNIPITLANIIPGTHISYCERSVSHHLVLARQSDGVLEVNIADEHKSLKTFAGMMTFAPNDTSQQYAFTGHTENTVIFFEPGFLAKIAKDWHPANAINLLEPQLCFTNARLEHLVKELNRTITSNQPGSRILAEAATLHLGAEIFRYFFGKRSKEGRSTLSENDIRDLNEFIQAYIDWDIGLSDLAELVSMDVFSFSRAFKAITGTSPGRHVMNLRIERACRLLADSQLSLAEIAYSCGFCSQSHLTSTFSKHMGISPGRYRRQVLQ